MSGEQSEDEILGYVKKFDGTIVPFFVPKTEAERPDEFVLKIAGVTNRLVSGHEIRRDYSIKQQLYFVTMAIFDVASQSPCLYVSQALGNPRTKQIEVSKFLEFWIEGNRKKNKTGSREYFIANHSSVIDEVSKRFYFLNSTDRCFTIAIYELSFDTKEDNFGYRKIKAKRTPKNIVLEQNPTVLRSNLFLVTQSSGQLIATCSSISNPLSHMAAEIKFTEDGLGASVVPGKGKFKASGKKITAEMILLSSLGHLVVVFSSEKDRHMFVCSYSSNLELLKCIKIDKVNIFKGCNAPCPRQSHQEFHLQLLGRVHKYTIFFFGSLGTVMLGLRWPRDWYSHNEPNGFRGYRNITTVAPHPERSYSGVRVHLVDNDLYCLFASADNGYTTLTRIPLEQELKNYRSCTHCGVQETHKRKNKAGKRIANFKVCRRCKEKYLHVPYCSFECIKKDWKKHKTIHE